MSWVLATVISTAVVGELPSVKESTVPVSSLDVCKAVVQQHRSLYNSNNWIADYHRGDNNELHVSNVNRSTKIVFICREQK